MEDAPMSKTPPHSPDGFYHLTIPLDALDDPLLAEDMVMVRPISKSEAEELTKRLQEIGRNQPCLCGSGRKYKKCCLRKAH
jgi:hypothetical protein